MNDYNGRLSVEKGSAKFSTLKTLKCNHCGGHFVAQRRSRKFCSVRCRQKYSYHLKRELARHDWHSPAQVIEAARTVMGGINLDPASCEAANEIVRAAREKEVAGEMLLTAHAKVYLVRILACRG